MGCDRVLGSLQHVFMCEKVDAVAVNAVVGEVGNPACAVVVDTRETALAVVQYFGANKVQIGGHRG